MWFRATHFLDCLNIHAYACLDRIALLLTFKTKRPHSTEREVSFKYYLEGEKGFNYNCQEQRNTENI